MARVRVSESNHVAPVPMRSLMSQVIEISSMLSHFNDSCALLVLREMVKHLGCSGRSFGSIISSILLLVHSRFTSDSLDSILVLCHIIDDAIKGGTASNGNYSISNNAFNVIGNNINIESKAQNTNLIVNLSKEMMIQVAQFLSEEDNIAIGQCNRQLYVLTQSSDYLRQRNEGYRIDITSSALEMMTKTKFDVYQSCFGCSSLKFIQNHQFSLTNRHISIVCDKDTASRYYDYNDRYPYWQLALMRSINKLAIVRQVPCTNKKYNSMINYIPIRALFSLNSNNSYNNNNNSNNNRHLYYDRPKLGLLFENVSHIDLRLFCREYSRCLKLNSKDDDVSKIRKIGQITVIGAPYVYQEYLHRFKRNFDSFSTTSWDYCAKIHDKNICLRLSDLNDFQNIFHKKMKSLTISLINVQCTIMIEILQLGKDFDKFLNLYDEINSHDELFDQDDLEDIQSELDELQLKPKHNNVNQNYQTNRDNDNYSISIESLNVLDVITILEYGCEQESQSQSDAGVWWEDFVQIVFKSQWACDIYDNYLNKRHLPNVKKLCVIDGSGICLEDNGNTYEEHAIQSLNDVLSSPLKLRLFNWINTAESIEFSFTVYNNKIFETMNVDQEYFEQELSDLMEHVLTKFIVFHKIKLELYFVNDINEKQDEEEDDDVIKLDFMEKVTMWCNLICNINDNYMDKFLGIKNEWYSNYNDNNIIAARKYNNNYNNNNNQLKIEYRIIVGSDCWNNKDDCLINEEINCGGYNDDIVANDEFLIRINKDINALNNRVNIAIGNEKFDIWNECIAISSKSTCHFNA